MNRPDFRRMLPAWKNVLLALLSAILLILAFPDFEIWWLAWFALVPLVWAVERQKESIVASAVLGWIFGVTFFFGTCWWLAYAPIHYAEFPALLAYFLVFCAAAGAAVFPATFAGVSAYLLKRFGHSAILATPTVWVFGEFLRYWLTGNNWNAIAYSQAPRPSFISPAVIGGIYLVGFWVLAINIVTYEFAVSRAGRLYKAKYTPVLLSLLWSALIFFPVYRFISSDSTTMTAEAGRVIGIQPDVPMSGLDYLRWQRLRTRHVELTEATLQRLPNDHRPPTTVVFPESPMNFMYEEDPEFRAFVSAFAAKNNVNVLFNSAEPDPENKRYYNSAVLVDTTGREIAQYDKIYLLPFGEAVPAPLQSIVPAFVGNFSYGKNYNLIPLGDAKAGVMICFESHFGQLSREYVRRGADALIEMTNDGYLGPTPVLRQHLANAVFRAVETNRPVLRVTNVGISAYINERGQVLDATQPYTEDSRVWSVAKSDGGQTFYVKYGDWFAWLCTAMTLLLLTIGIVRRESLRNK